MFIPCVLYTNPSEMNVEFWVHMDWTRFPFNNVFFIKLLKQKAMEIRCLCYLCDYLPYSLISGEIVYFLCAVVNILSFRWSFTFFFQFWGSIILCIYYKLHFCRHTCIIRVFIPPSKVPNSFLFKSTAYQVLSINIHYIFRASVYCFHTTLLQMTDLLTDHWRAAEYSSLIVSLGDMTDYFYPSPSSNTFRN